MPRRRDLLLPAIVGASTIAHWVLGRRFDGFWIMPDEAIYARRALALWHQGDLPLVGGEGAGYGVLYPVLIAPVLAVGDFGAGYASLKLLQALVMSLAAVPVFVWALRVATPAWAAAAAILTVLSPLLLYSGLVMTEVLFYPVAAFALLAIARAVEEATPRAQALALVAIAAGVLTRVQGVVLLGVFALAVVLDAAFARRVRRLRLFWPLWAVVATAGVVTAVAPAVFGSYAEVVRGDYPLGEAARLTLQHAGWSIFSTGVVPAAALALLVLRAARGREADPAVRALAAVGVAAVVLVSAQIGVFASRYAPHLLERNLASLPPVLFVAFAAWLSRGAPRPQLAAPAIALGILAAVVALPWQRLAVEEALPDSFGLAVVYQLREHDPAVIATAAAAVLLALFAVVPRRAAAVLPTAVAGGLLASTLVATDEIGARVRYDQTHLVGTPRDWIDRAAAGRPVTYLYHGEAYFNGVWQAVVWNPGIARVLAVAPSRVPGPIPQEQVEPASDGSLGFGERYVVASTPHGFRGERVAEIPQIGTDVGGIAVWRLDPPARLSTLRRGIRPDGDMTEPGLVTAWDCAGGRLELTLLPKATRVVTVLLDDEVVLRERIGGLEYWNGAVTVPPAAAPRVCRFTIRGESLLGSTRIEFVRP